MCPGEREIKNLRLERGACYFAMSWVGSPVLDDGKDCEE